MNEIAGYIPDIGDEDFTKRILVFKRKNEEVEVEIPLLTIEQMNKVIEKVKRASVETLKAFTTVGNHGHY